MNLGILCYPTSGGSGIVATEIGAGLARRGHEVHVFSYRAPFRHRPASDRFHFHPVEMPSYPLFEYPSYGIAAAGALARAVEAYDLKVLHVHYAYPHSVSAFLAREMTGRTGLRIVTTLHGTDIALSRQEESFADVVRFGLRRSDAVTAVSEFLRTATLNWFGAGPEIEVIPNFVDADRFHPRRGRATRVPLIVHVSNFRPVKRSLDAVRAFYLIRRRIKSRLLLVGLGPDVEPARDLVARLDLGDDVVFHGEEPAIEETIASADLLLGTSEFEGFGLAVLEAMACEVPVVSTHAGGVAEIVESGRTGFLVPVGDVDALAERSVEILSDRGLARRMGQAGRRRAVEAFRPDRILSQYENLYGRLITITGERPRG